MGKLPDLEEECPLCGGEGYYPVRVGIQNTREEVCPHCEGTGVQPNREGDKLLTFIKAYFKVSLRE